MNETLTIITTTYNRENQIQELYKSLELQKVKDFSWIVIDDGSVDNTAETMGKIINAASFPVSYIAKENGGKHTALNVGIKEINTDLTMIVDSDDQLLPEAIEEINKLHEKYKSDKEVGAYCFQKCRSDGNPILSLEKDEFIASYVDYRIKGNRPGDMAEVFKTKALKEFPFPEFEREKFLSEDVVWIQIGLKYKFVFKNKAIYKCEYLENGLTANDKPIKFASPKGSMLRGKMLMNKACGIVANIKGGIIYNVYRVDNNSPLLLCNCREKVLIALTKPLGNIFRAKWRNSK